MKLTVLGNSNRYLSPLGTGVSYLLSAGDTHVVVDCANGTAARLREILGDTLPAGLILPHHHPECLADALPVVRALPAEAPVLVPRGALPEVREALARAAGHHVRVLDFREVSEGTEETVGALRFRFARARHGCAAVAFRASANGSTLAWWGDTGYLPGLRAVAEDAGLLVAHTLLLDADGRGELAQTNLPAGEAARLAAQSRVARLALAHVPFYEDAEASLQEARRHFPGEVFVLAERGTYTV